MCVLHIDPFGTITCPYTEQIPLTTFGTLHVERASHIEWHDQEQGWTITLKNGDQLPNTFPSRQDALAYEANYIHEHFSEMVQPHPYFAFQ
ncbi:MAG: hypothetical protein NPIRA02_02390 [Nitrospirales bacterium]|nr:MAG: hypothetical protein NPIRA02_02390 [Nitrospirales bacterium]